MRFIKWFMLIVFVCASPAWAQFSGRSGVYGGSGGGSIGGTITGGTANSVLFLGAGSVLAQDNANFYYDPIAHILNLSGGEKYTGPYTQQITFTAGSSGLQQCSGSTVCVTASSAIQLAGYSIPGFSNVAPSSVYGSFLVWGAAVGTPPVVPDPTWKAFDGNAAHFLNGSGTFTPAPQNLTAVFDGGGSPLVTATVYFSAVPGPCTIWGTASEWDTGSATFTVWDLAAGTTADASATNTISNAGIAVSVGHNLTTNASDFTVSTGTAVSANDKLAVHIVPDGTMTRASFQIRCN
jgi:hypothetical protein